MSDSSSLKNPLSNASRPKLEKTLEMLRQPFSIAVLASLGVHGLLWVGLPWMTQADEPAPDNQRSVQVVELSPLEQARLPQTQSPLSSLLAPFNKSSQSKTQPDTSTANIPTVPTDPAVIDSMPYYNIPGLWSGTSSYSSSRQRVKVTETQEPEETKQTTKKETKETKDQDSKSEQKDETSQKGENEEKQDDATQSEKVSTNADDLKEEKLDDKQLLALQQKYTFNEAGTTDADVSANSAAAGKLAEKYGIAEWSKKAVISAAYPKEACQFKYKDGAIKGETTVVAIIQEDGKLAEASLIKSSGFPGLDEAAKTYLAKQWNQAWEDINKKNKINLEGESKVVPITLIMEPSEADCAGKGAEKTS